MLDDVMSHFRKGCTRSKFFSTLSYITLGQSPLHKCTFHFKINENIHSFVNLCFGLCQLPDESQMIRSLRTSIYTVSCIDYIFSCNILVWDTSGGIRIYTTRDMWSNVSQTKKRRCWERTITTELQAESWEEGFTFAWDTFQINM